MAIAPSAHARPIRLNCAMARNHDREKPRSPYPGLP